MDINTSDFPIGKGIIYVSEDQCLYDLPVTKLETAWNSLAAYYSEKLNSDNSEAIKTGEFYRALAHFNVENETALTVYQLIKQDVIRTFPSFPTQERPVSLSKYILENVREILLKRLEELKKNIDSEKAMFELIRGIFHEVKIVDGQICVYYSRTCTLTFGSFKELYERQLHGLSCVIRFREIRLSCYEMNTAEEYASLVDSHFYEQMLPQTYEKNGLCVEISTGRIDGDNALCKTILAELKQGHKLERLHEMIIIGLSRVCVWKLLGGYKSIKPVNTEESILVDGCSRIFYVLTDDHVYKVVRQETTFDIYLDGRPLVLYWPEN